MLKKNLPVWDQKMLEGGLRSLRKAVLRQGRAKFGPPSAEIEAFLEGIEDEDHLQIILDAITPAQNWEQLIATTP